MGLERLAAPVAEFYDLDSVALLVSSDAKPPIVIGMLVVARRSATGAGTGWGEEQVGWSFARFHHRRAFVIIHYDTAWERLSPTIA